MYTYRMQHGNAAGCILCSSEFPQLAKLPPGLPFHTRQTLSRQRHGVPTLPLLRFWRRFGLAVKGCKGAMWEVKHRENTFVDHRLWGMVMQGCVVNRPTGLWWQYGAQQHVG